MLEARGQHQAGRTGEAPAAKCQRRSPVRSECRPTRSEAITPVVAGTMA